MRTNSIYAYFCTVLAINTMKARLNLTIEQSLLEEVKKFAAQKKTSVSELVEDYFKVITKPKRKSLLEVLDELPKINIDANKNLGDLYFEHKMKELRNEQ
jgi:hypothetical protein